MALRAGSQTQAAPRQQQSGAQAAEAPRENVAAPPAPGDDGPWLPWGHLHPQTGGWMTQVSSPPRCYHQGPAFRSAQFVKMHLHCSATHRSILECKLKNKPVSGHCLALTGNHEANLAEVAGRGLCLIKVGACVWQASPVSWGQPGASTEPSPAAQGGAQLPFSWAANTAPMPQPTLEAPASGPVPEDQQNSIAQSFRVRSPLKIGTLSTSSCFNWRDPGRSLRQ